MSTPAFGVVTDGGLDAYAGLRNDVPVAPFSVTFGNTSYRTNELSREALFRELASNPAHPTSSQPTPQDWVDAYRGAGTPAVLAVTISAGLSGSRNAAEQARTMAGAGVNVHIHDSRTLSAAQAFQVHAAATAAERGEPLETALAWMAAVERETELYFTIETLEYLRRGGRIGRVQATLGGLLDLKPVVTVDKATGAYTNVGRARSYRGGIAAVADRVTRTFGEGTPLRLGLLHGSEPADADTLLGLIAARHPVVWSGVAGVNPVLNVHTGPRAVGVAAAPGHWPWDR
ncbi:DegV family protein with EDD domain [Deinococcus metalli]|uniref:DegV domain-containing protein n=1 Tax=Deinococcus metalli TaxID=1141878 RepID=A0A7W8KCJ2_9DEIO|nr:DegV family protein [Deinococcus metalli]MBB5375420.1 DegV family protein with EDD domain [Deinococcus metalli]GHF29419.1 DegV domain-containing protein [Deinococcus metalli]